MAINNTIGIEVKKRLQDISDIKQESGESVKRSLEAKSNADEAKYRSDITKKQLEEAIKNGDQVVEVQTGRVDPLTGKVHPTLSDRLEANQKDIMTRFEELSVISVSLLKFGGSILKEDNQQPIIKALDYLVAQGGGELIIPPGVFYTSPFVSRSNVTIRAQKGGCLKTKENNGEYQSLISLQNTENSSLLDLEIDLNREGTNSVVVDKYGKKNAHRAIYMANTKNATIQGNKIKSHGIWTIIADTSDLYPDNNDITVEDNEIEWTEGYIETTLPGLPLNVNYDNTMIYIDAKKYSIKRNKIKTTSIAGMTGIEAHRGDGIVEDNFVDGFRTSVFVVPMVAKPETDSDDTRTKVMKNTLVNTSYGVMLYPVTTKELSNVIIETNEIILDSTRNNEQASYGIGVRQAYGDTGLKPIKNTKINGNQITFMDDQRIFSNPDYTTNFVGIKLLSGVDIESTTVENNTIINPPAIGIMVGAINNSSYRFKGGYVGNNTIINAGNNKNLTSTYSIPKTPLRTGFGVEKTIIGTNNIIDTNHTPLYDRPFMLPSNTESNANEVIVNRQNVVANDETLIQDGVIYDFKPVLDFDDGSGLPVLKSNGYYVKYDNLVIVNCEITISNMAGATGYAANVKLPFVSKCFSVGNVTYFENLSTPRVDIGCNIEENSDTLYFRTSLNDGSSLGTILPSHLKNGSKIAFEISYPIE